MSRPSVIEGRSEIFESLKKVKRFVSKSESESFCKSVDFNLFNLEDFPDFFKDFVLGKDICQNFTFLKLYQMSHKMRRFCESNIARLKGRVSENPEIIGTLIANLQLSRLKIDRLLRFTVSKINKALATYSGFFMLYDKFIFKAVEEMNTLICEWYSDCLKTVSKFQFLENKFLTIFNFK